MHRFDPPDRPWGSGHRGVDLLGSDRQRVFAVADGVVSYAGTLAGRGVIAVMHDGIKSTYEPVEPTVKIGDRVRPGDTLGRLQTAASHCAPRTCLHWGAVRGSTYVDPLGLVGIPGPIRLLPSSELGSATVVASSWVPPTTPNTTGRQLDRIRSTITTALDNVLPTPA